MATHHQHEGLCLTNVLNVALSVSDDQSRRSTSLESYSSPRRPRIISPGASPIVSPGTPLVDKLMQYECRARRAPPRRPTPAFLMWSNKKKAKLKKKLPNATNGELSKILAKKWKELPPEAKQPYQEEEREKRAKYKEEIAKWEMQHGEPDTKVQKNKKKAIKKKVTTRIDEGFSSFANGGLAAPNLSSFKRIDSSKSVMPTQITDQENNGVLPCSPIRLQNHALLGLLKSQGRQLGACRPSVLSSPTEVRQTDWSAGFLGRNSYYNDQKALMFQKAAGRIPTQVNPLDCPQDSSKMMVLPSVQRDGVISNLPTTYSKTPSPFLQPRKQLQTQFRKQRAGNQFDIDGSRPFQCPISAFMKEKKGYLPA